MNTVRVSKEEFTVALMNQQRKNSIAKARREQEIFMEYRKGKSIRLRKYER